MAANALVLRFAAETGGAKKALMDLATSGAGQMAALATASAVAGQKIDRSLVGTMLKVASSVTAAQLAYGGFATVAAASIAVAIERLAEYRKLAEQAGALGLSTEFFQKFTQSAGDAKSKVDLLTEALKNARTATRETLDGSAVGNRIDEFSRNGGFSAAGEAARDAFRNAPDAEARVQAVVRAIDDLIARGYQLEGQDLAEKAFGASAADALIARANAAGQSLAEMVNTSADKKVVSPEQIENARQLEERLENARKTMKDGMEPILRDLEALGVAFYKGWVSTEEAIAAITKKMGQLYTATKAVVGLLPSLSAVDGAAQTGADQARLTSLQSQLRSAVGPERARIERQIGEYQSRIYASQGQRMLAADAVPFITMPENGPVALGPNDPLARRGAVPPRRSLLDSNQPSAGSSRSSGGSGTDGDLEAYERYVATIEKAVAALQAENETIGLGTYARERALGLAKAKAEFDAKDIELTETQKKALEDLIDRQARLKETIEANKAAHDEFNSVLKFAGTSISSVFSDVVSGGKNAEQAMMNLLKRLVDVGAQAFLLGDGPLKNIFGMGGRDGQVGGIIGALTSLAGFRADGGMVTAGRPYLVGERGPEIFTPATAGGITPNGKGGAGRTVHIIQHNTFNGQQNRAEIEAMLERNNRALKADIAADMAQRGPGRVL